MTAARVAVVTVVAGRHEHLRAQRAALVQGKTLPAQHILVAIDDPSVSRIAAEQPTLPTVVLDQQPHAAGLPVASARNRGAARALGDGADVLIFLDVDCIPGAALVQDYARAVRDHPDALVSGPVTYLPPAPHGSWTPAALEHARAPHPARPDPLPGEAEALAPELFWSLSFALNPALWQGIGGFWEGYVGYGAEDTDFAATAAALGVPVLMIGGIDAFHQHHPVSDPPREHLDDIARNSAIFCRRHGRLPMRGWLDRFVAEGRLALTPHGPRRPDAPVVATIPARHPYLDAVLPATVRRFATERVVAWEPDPVLRPDLLRAAAAAIDVVHVHFSFEHRTPDELGRWLETLDDLGIPLVVTVHDLRNPHARDRHRHDAHLAALLAHAAHAFTLTAAAADECAHRFGRRPEVAAHPPLDLAGAVPDAAAKPEVLLPLKNLRVNVCDADRLVQAVAEGVAPEAATVRVLLDPAAARTEPGRAVLSIAEQWPGTVGIDLVGHLPDAELTRLVARTHACVLPYRWGTHSGWIELCRDLGVHVVAPDCGHYAAQWPAVRTFGNTEDTGLDETSLRDAVGAACRTPRPAPAPSTERAVLVDLLRARHDALYRQLTQR